MLAGYQMSDSRIEQNMCIVECRLRKKYKNIFNKEISFKPIIVRKTNESKTYQKNIYEKSHKIIQTKKIILMAISRLFF